MKIEVRSQKSGSWKSDVMKFEVGSHEVRSKKS